MLTKAFILVLIMLVGLALGFETARYVHSAGGASTGMVNIHLAVFAGMLLTMLWLSRVWLARQWTRFTVWLELTLDGLFDFNSLDVGDGLGSVSVSPRFRWSVANTRRLELIDRELEGRITPEEGIELERLQALTDIEFRPLHQKAMCRLNHEACAQDALDDAAKTTCTGCGDRGHPAARPPPSREGRQPNGSYVVEVRPGETHEGPV